MKLFSASFDANYPNLRQSLFLVILFFTIFISFSLIVTMPYAFGWQLLPLFHDFIYALATPIYYMPLILYVSKKSGTRIKWKVKYPSVSLVLLLVLFGISLLIIAFPLNNPIDYLSNLVEGRIKITVFETPELSMNGAIHFIRAVLIVPVFEEIFWRKQIFGLFLKKHSPVVSIVLSSALFASSHFRIFDIGALFIYGLLFGFVYYKTKSLEASILLHSVVNLFSRFFRREYIEITSLQFPKYIIIMVICAVIIYLIIRYLKRYGEVEKDIGAIDSGAS